MQIFKPLRGRQAPTKQVARSHPIRPVYVLIAAVQGDFPQLQDRFPALLQNLPIMVVRA